ncbi:hypothetical protein PINS_up011911 [Pythium insidiosum]|nr:hypothetical protein PINS_up011911 [Pythium insidiosum]
MAARSPGLARVFASLLGFEGNEFYFKEWPECVGVKFGELTERFPNAIPLGIKRKAGDVLIAPDFDLVVGDGDQIMVLAEDDDTYKACAPAQIAVGELPVVSVKTRSKERILMCGWRRDIRDMIRLLDSLVVEGTELHIVCEEPVNLRDKMLMESGLNVSTLSNLRILHHFGNTAIRRHLEPLPLHAFTSIMILADQSREGDIMHSDSHTLASLLLIRDLQVKRLAREGLDISSSEGLCKCICEILDPRTQRTISTSATILQLSEFIQSNELVSCILAMIAESRDVRVILDELLGSEGASFAVEPFSRYCTQMESVSFWQLAKRAMMLGEILCGYQSRGAIDETTLNPSEKATPRRWVGVDLIVLRRQSSTPIVHLPAPHPVHPEEFERRSMARMSKSSFMRQQILEALVQEQEAANIDQLNTRERERLTRAVRSYVETTHSDGVDAELAQIDSKTVRSFVAVARMLADTLERYEKLQVRQHGSSGDGDVEAVSEFDELAS